MQASEADIFEIRVYRNPIYSNLEYIGFRTITANSYFYSDIRHKSQMY